MPLWLSATVHTMNGKKVHNYGPGWHSGHHSYDQIKIHGDGDGGADTVTKALFTHCLWLGHTMEMDEQV